MLGSKFQHRPLVKKESKVNFLILKKRDRSSSLLVLRNVQLLLYLGKLLKSIHSGDKMATKICHQHRFVDLFQKQSKIPSISSKTAKREIGTLFFQQALWRRNGMVSRTIWTSCSAGTHIIWKDTNILSKSKCSKTNFWCISWYETYYFRFVLIYIGFFSTGILYLQ